MITLVLDTSVAVELFLRDRPADASLRRRVLTGSAAAPELLDLETCNVARKMVARGEVSLEDAAEAVRDIRESPVLRISHRHLMNRVWQLRNTLTAYDASYIALAELMNAPLLTCDVRMARAGGHDAQVEVYPRS